MISLLQALRTVCWCPLFAMALTSNFVLAQVSTDEAKKRFEDRSVARLNQENAALRKEVQSLTTKLTAAQKEIARLKALIPTNSSATKPTITNSRERIPKSPVQTVATPSLPKGFRNSLWGMSREEVIKAEGKTPLNGDDVDTLMFDDNLLGLEVTVGYVFVDGKLVRGVYLLDERHTNNNQHIDDFDKIVSELREKYGKPKSRNEFWSRDLYKGNPDERGMAVAVGDLSIYETWEGPGEDTMIVAVVKGDNFDITVKVEYSGEKYRGLEQQRRQAKESKKL